ncbi:MAG: cell division protein FtsA [Desulfuromonadaceae bacterium]|nr:cell division protein FtsA [Desulfuromonadaceae bacterium]
MHHELENIVVGLDVGTAKICVVVGKHIFGTVEIIGVGQCLSSGLQKGFVIDIERTASAIRKAVDEAELMSGCAISNSVVGIADRFIHAQNTSGMITLTSHEVLAGDVQRVIESAQSIALHDDRKILHTILQEFIVDTHHRIEHPVGIRGTRLEARVHLITAGTASINNIVKACKKAALEATEIVLQPLASAEAVLMPEEREMGVVMIDIGCGTTDVALFTSGTLRHTAVIPVAGSHLTGDLAVGLHITLSEAERLKCLYGCCQKEIHNETSSVEVFASNGIKSSIITEKSIRMILQARVTELFAIVAKELELSGFKNDLVAGVVITGGSSLLPGIDRLAEQVLDMPVRLGKPLNMEGLAENFCKPQYSTGIGLVLKAATAGVTPVARPTSLFEAAKLQFTRLREYF